jgi:hypothetical protein
MVDTFVKDFSSVTKCTLIVIIIRKESTTSEKQEELKMLQEIVKTWTHEILLFVFLLFFLF